MCATLSKLITTRCANNLLSIGCDHGTFVGPYFTPIDLANFARELDEAERQRMAEGDTQSVEFLKYMQVYSELMYMVYN